MINSGLNNKQKKEAELLIEEFEDIFSDIPTMTNIVEHKVELTRDEPIKSKPYPIPYKCKKWLIRR